MDIVASVSESEVDEQDPTAMEEADLAPFSTADNLSDIESNCDTNGAAAPENDAAAGDDEEVRRNVTGAVTPAIADLQFDTGSPIVSPAQSMHSELSVDIDEGDSCLAQSPEKNTTSGAAPASSTDRHQPAVTRKQPSSTDTSDLKQYQSKLTQLFRDARFFIIKSNNEHNVELSKRCGVWSTPPSNEAKLNRAYRECRNVLLIFSVKESGRFAGFCRLAAESSRELSPVAWQLPAGIPASALGGVFRVLWICRVELSFSRCTHLFNSFNGNRPVKVGRDGQEVAPRVAQRLCRLFARDTQCDNLDAACAASRLHRTLPGKVSVHCRLAPQQRARVPDRPRNHRRHQPRNDPWRHWAPYLGPPLSPDDVWHRRRRDRQRSPPYSRSVELRPRIAPYRGGSHQTWSPPDPPVPAMFSDLAREMTARGAPMPPVPPPLSMFDTPALPRGYSPLAILEDPIPRHLHVMEDRVPRHLQVMEERGPRHLALKSVASFDDRYSRRYSTEQVEFQRYRRRILHY